ncbi:MAG: alpha-mannosidase [Anaerolineae bacterium]
MPYQAYIVSHTHWDREWYQPFQEFRIRLVTLVDRLLDILASDPSYRHFMLDGHSIVVEDYLQIRPEREPDIREQVQKGRLLIGPWYVLPDEFLVSPEALIRNLMLGQRVARRFGEPMTVGYIPDSFGHISQLPQILAGFGIHDVAIWRGVPDLPTEFLWQSPDGSAVLTIYIRDGYGNLAWTPRDPDGFAQIVRQAVDSLVPHATTHAILLMNGTDHMEPFASLPALMALAEERLPHLKLVHGTLPQYVAAVRAANPALQTVQGEFRSSQRSNIIPGVLSARIWIKQRNRACETLLEGWAEPFSAFAGSVNSETRKSVNSGTDLRSYDSTKLRFYEFTTFAWRYLLQNHPHDSICGCSVDQVHEEMRFRFDQVEQIAKEITRRSLASLVGHITTKSPKLDDPQEALPAGDLVEPAPYVPIVVFNPTDGPRTDLVHVQVQIPPAWPGYGLVDEEDQPLPWQKLGEEKLDFSLLGIDREDLLSRLTQEHPERVGGQGIVRLRYHEGKAGPVVVMTLGAHGRPSPIQVETALTEIRRRLHAAGGKPPAVEVELAPLTALAFVAQGVPGHGYRTYFLRPGPARLTREARTGALNIENEFFHIEADPVNGSITLRDKTTGIVYRGLNRFVDEGDRGDVYNYCPVEQDVVVDEPARPPVVRLLETGPARQTLEIALRYRVPARLTASRRARLARRVTLPITTRISLVSGVRRVDFETTVNNAARDHRLRVCFPTPVKTDCFRTETPFDVVERPLDLPTETSGWPEQPAPTHPQRTFSDVSDEWAGLTLINCGLPEVEARREPDGTVLLLTLLRCVGWLSRDDMPVRPGHAGPGVPLPGAQCLGAHTFRYALVPYGGDRETPGWLSTFPQAYAFNAPMRAVVAEPHDGPLPAAMSFIEVSPTSVIISAIKLAEEGDGLIVRVWNVAPASVEARLALNLPFSRAFLTDLNERSSEELDPDADNVVRLSLRPRQVKTVRFER